MARRSDKRPQIMLAAEGLFTSRRFHEITLASVARAAKVSKGTIYTYFKGKEDLFFQIAMSGFDDLCNLLNENVPDDASFRGQLARACQQISGFFGDRRQLFRMIQSEDSRMHWCRGGLREKWRSRRRKLVSAVARIMRTGVGAGEVRADVPVDVLADFFLGMLRTRARHLAAGLESSSSEAPEKAWVRLRAGPRRRRARSRELLVDLFYHGACAPEGRAPARRRR